ncbi:AraC family transcriptional regulator [Lacinutrix neustonica]|uniref:AraC family transcriptional regulator n=1 Tax=Lacinutrix neustonica TaxID=2980107 RepID=A0A9E8MZK0_9FLAO|nr:AraC family transcriptional regulator [Lacinutrix neustonica]WAC03149.1 AraC family transcriptional regulator [Lacinutrix neustonica]
MSYPFLKTFGVDTTDVFLNNFQRSKSGHMTYFHESTGDKRISLTLNKIKKYWNIEQGNNVLVKAAIAELQSVFMQQYLILNSDNILSNLEIQKISELPGIIMDQLNTNLTSKILASQVAIKIDRLELGCDIIFKCNLSVLIDEIKLENVANLLMTTDNSLAEIAYQNGYTQRSYLYTVFLKRFGCSPSEYKNNCLKKLG